MLSKLFLYKDFQPPNYPDTERDSPDSQDGCGKCRNNNVNMNKTGKENESVVKKLN